MKISLEWLNSYLGQPVSADEVEQCLTALGLPIEQRKELSGGDIMLDVEVTSNRPDCLCHLGIAREVAAGMGRAIVAPSCDLPKTAVSAKGAKTNGLATVRVDDSALCPLYTARVIRGVKIGGSPSWLVRRLDAVGLRSINNVVDATNYVLMELQQPLHAFDLGKLADQAIIVRRAAAGESITAIDGSKHRLSADMLVIADGRRPVAVAGIMGGLESEVSSGTTDILLESAIFAPLSVRQTSRTLKLASDSSYRFERGVDPRGVEIASRRATQLICQLTGGTLAGNVIRVGMPEPQLRKIELRVKRCRALLGLDLRGKEMMTLLGKLGLDPVVNKVRKSIVCTAPTYRLDLTREVDLIEEVGRLAGLDRVRVRKKIRVVARPVQLAVAAARTMRGILVAHGYLEAVTSSFLAPRLGEPFLPEGATAVHVDDERRKHEGMLRPALLPSLLACRKTNQDGGNKGLRLFESAAVWHRAAGAVVETRRLGMICDVEEPDGVERALRDVRGTLEELAGQLSGRVLAIEPVKSKYLTVAASLTGGVTGILGVVSPAIQRLFDLQTSVVMAEVDLATLLGSYPPPRAVHGVARFPAIERDVSVVIPASVRWARIESEVRGALPALLENLHFVTTYRGKPIPPGQKSLTFRLVFRNPQATLRHEQVDPQVAAVVERLAKAVGAQLRA